MSEQVKMRKCTKCGVEKEERRKNFRWIDSDQCFEGQCKKCRKKQKKQEYNKQYWANNKEVLTEYNTQYREIHRDQINGRMREYYQENRDDIAEYNKQYAETHKEQISEYMKEYNKTYYSDPSNVKRRSNTNKRGFETLKKEAIERYGNKCLCCGETEIKFLTIDHIDNTGAEHRKEIGGTSIYRWLKKNGYPKENFRVLCYNCNCASYLKGYCHEAAPIFICPEKLKHTTKGHCYWCDVLLTPENKRASNKCKACAHLLDKKKRLNAFNIVVNHYGGECACCKENRTHLLTVDHINNDGAEHRRQNKRKAYVYNWIIENNFPDDLQLLCWNCNCCKGKHRECPHQEG